MELARLILTGAVVSALAACVSLDNLASGQGASDGPAAPDERAGTGGGSSSGGVNGAGAGSGGSTSSSSSSSGGGARTDAAAPPAACPGKPFPPGVAVGTYCVDATEVTNGDYQLFLDDVGPTPAWGSQPPECTFNASYVPAAMPGLPMLPATGVNWCQAYAYCKWAGKRLCGAIGGGPVDAATPAWKDAKVDQWFRACTFSGTRTYPYGATYVASACNGSDVSTDENAVAVMTYLKCEGGYAGIFDMSGNVREWEDSCAGTSGPTDKCRTRGGAADNGEAHLTCDHDESYDRSYSSFRTGFRCCSP